MGTPSSLELAPQVPTSPLLTFSCWALPSELWRYWFGVAQWRRIPETGWFGIAVCDLQTRCNELLNMGAKVQLDTSGLRCPIGFVTPVFSNSLHLVCISQAAISNQPISITRIVHSSGHSDYVACQSQWLQGAHWSYYKEPIPRISIHLLTLGQLKWWHGAHWKDYKAPS